MADNVAIELVFRQQVAAKPLKNIPKTSKTPLFTIGSSRGRAASG